MSSLYEQNENLIIPREQKVRQAISSLRGYSYQIYQSLASWISLKEDEILFLETAEDFAVLAKGILNATQVKDTRKSSFVTLTTKSVSKVIKSLWDFQEANPEKTICIDYLTTSKIKKERGLTFPDDHTGITYWRVAAREGTNVEPIRQGLLTLELNEKISRFIEDATPEQLREKILRRIKWHYGREDIHGLEKTILDKLIYLGEKQNYTPSDCERARDSLVVEILSTIIKENDRKLNRADLLRLFHKSCSVSMPVSSMRRKYLEATSGIMGAFSGDLVSEVNFVINVSKIPLPQRTIDRNKLVSELFSVIGQSGTLWLHGSSGIGKTILSRLIARQSERDWLIVPLRECSARELQFRLDRTIEALSRDRFGGVILDDFPTKYVHDCLLHLMMISSELRGMDGTILIASSKPPSPDLQNYFKGIYTLLVPYLSIDEVTELVELAGGDSKKWAGVIYASCGPGHPQLVQARISGLSQKNWPKEELLSGFYPSFGTAKEIDSQRDSIRERLLSEIPENAQALLSRLSLIIGYFDRELAIEISEVNPKITQAGENLDVLIGPWIEMQAKDRFRISPLVSDAGIKNLSKSMQSEVHKRIVDQLITRHPFPADFLGSLLGHALCSRHEGGLMWLAMAVLHTPHENRKMITEQLFVLQFLDSCDKKPIFPENLLVSSMLRLAQFKVTAWSNRTENLPAITDQLFTEARALERTDISAGFLFLTINTVLIERNLNISPKKWMPLLLELEKAISCKGELAEFVRTLDPVKKGIDGYSVPQFLFALRATSLKSIDELFELFSELENLSYRRRKTLLSSLAMVPSGKRLMIDSAWLSESRTENMDGVASAEKFRQLAKIAEKWGERKIAVDCEYARAVMLDEYANDSDGALASLNEAEEKYPNNVRLIRQRASVYYRKGDHPTALEIIAGIADVIPEEEHIDRAFALREAGISAAETGDFDKASHFFSDACKAAYASTDNMRPMAIGLKGDHAFAKFKSGNKREALNLMHQAIIDAEQLNPQLGKKQKYCRLILGNLILWMQEQVRGNPLLEGNIQIIPGCCSNPEPSEKIMEFASQPFLAYWYHLAILEAMLGMDSCVLKDLRKRTQTERILSCELYLNHQLMAKYIFTIDTETFFSYLPEYIVKAVYMSEYIKNSKRENIYDFMSDDFPLMKKEDWKDKLHLWLAKDAIIALTVAATCTQVSNFLKILQYHANAITTLKPFIRCFKKDSCKTRDLHEVFAYCLGRILDEKALLSPDDIFIITYRSWDYLRHSNFRDTLEDMVTDYFIGKWQDILKNQRFNLKQPMINAPAIQNILKEETKGISKIAALVLVAENAVKYQLTIKQRSELTNFKN
ncbi:MAG: hypothetical protein JW787_15210 [Sedimentisphaerales bacterium]|nr:hypothetical protein [Sedimentisphaerales bacterium]